jgi:two-component system sensor histidine kinase GlrK
MFFLTNLFRSHPLGRLVLIGYALAVLPLVLAIVSAVFAVEELAILSQKAVYQVAQQAQKSRMLLERLTESERKGRQYLVLEDASARQTYEESHRQFGEVVANLLNLTESESLAGALKQLESDEQNAYEWIVAPAAGQEPKPDTADKVGKLKTHLQRVTLEQERMPKTVEHFQDLNTKAREISRRYAELVDQEANDLATRSRGVQRRLLIQSAILLPVSVALISFFIYIIIRPIRQMDHSIRSLGAGDFAQPIKVLGPRDLEFLGERLEWLRSRLNNLEEAKQRFMRNVSHDIKTPLATIHEGTELLADEVVGELNPEQKEIAQIMVSNTQKLDALIAELINYSQVNAQIGERKLERVNMRELVLNLVEDYQIRLRAKSLAIKDSIGVVEMLGNPDQLRTIVDNLLSNAIKYSPVGGDIRIMLRKTGGHMELEIEDNGPGIDPDERLHVFEPFFQGRAARAAGVKGTGFGLAIVSECVASHHGKVEVIEPRGGKTGARISVKIPLK